MKRIPIDFRLGEQESDNKTEEDLRELGQVLTSGHSMYNNQTGIKEQKNNKKTIEKKKKAGYLG